MSDPRSSSQGYVGRFAPSPTGPLHLGSLVCAVASFLEARANGGQWLLRIEDLDPPRQVAGSTERILRSLDTHQLFWDGAVVYQSDRGAAYQHALEQLGRLGRRYYCTCTRNDVAAMGGRYDGKCRQQLHRPSAPHAIRFRAPDHAVAFADQIQGEVLTTADALDDFIVLRKDGLFAYQLAVVVDDAWQGITHVVRGADLLDSTPRQILLQEAFKFSQPKWMHIPVLATAGKKLSKQHGASGLDDDQAGANLIHALTLLGQNCRILESTMPPGEILEYASSHWNPDRIPHAPSLELTP